MVKTRMASLNHERIINGTLMTSLNHEKIISGKNSNDKFKL